MDKEVFCWGGKRHQAGRKRTCLNKRPFNRRVNTDVIAILKEYAKIHNITETEALESAILQQMNIYKLKGGNTMILAIPTTEGKLCPHYGHCETFTFVETNPETCEILKTYSGVPEEGITCQSANWIAQKGANVVLVGGIGGRPQSLFAQNGVKVVAGCPELEIATLVELFLKNELILSDNSCGHDEHHHCHGGDGRS